MIDFLKRYHAVPCSAATGTPSFQHATPAALIGWAEADCAAWDATENLTDRRHLESRMFDLAVELQCRGSIQWNRDRLHYGDPGYFPFYGTSRKIIERIGRLTDILTEAQKRS